MEHAQRLANLARGFPHHHARVVTVDVPLLCVEPAARQRGERAVVCTERRHAVCVDDHGVKVDVKHPALEPSRA